MMISAWRQLTFLGPLALLPLLLTGVIIFYYEPWTSQQYLNGRPSQIKHTHLVIGAAAGQGLAGRLQCNGLIALSATVKGGLNGPCLRAKEAIVKFVTFFMHHRQDDQVASSEIVKFGNSSIRRVDLPQAVLGIFLESLEVSMPTSKATILTDEASQIMMSRQHVHVSVQRTHGEFARDNLMLQRLQTYINFLETTLANLKYKKVIEHLIFMDSDIIIVGDLGCIFKTHTGFDIALTFRNNKHQPINSGVILVRGQPESISRAKDFLVEVVKQYKTRFVKAAKMLGDQLSLAAVVKENSNISSLNFKKPSSFVVQILKAKTLFLPSLLYNWTPSEGAGQFHGMPEDVKVLHFKGSRKRIMLEAWDFYKQNPASLSDMECLVLSSGRTKYDF